MTQITNHAPITPDIKELPKGNEKKPLNSKETALVFITAGILEVAVDQPLVTIKNALQKRVNIVKKLANQPANAIKKEAQIGIKNLFSFRVLYAGFGANATGMAGVTMIQGLSNDHFKNYLSQGNQKSLSEGEKLIAAVLAGALSALASCPSEKLMDRHNEQVKAFRTNQQIKPTLTKLYPTYTTTCMKEIKIYGPLSFYDGLIATMWRDSGFTAAYLVGTPYFKKLFKPYIQNEKALNVASGVTAGMLAAAATHPFDTRKTQIQARMTLQFWQGSVLKTIHAAYSGFTARITRVSMAVFLLSTATEKGSQLLQKMKA